MIPTASGTAPENSLSGWTNRNMLQIQSRVARWRAGFLSIFLWPQGCGFEWNFPIACGWLKGTSCSLRPLMLFLIIILLISRLDFHFAYSRRIFPPRIPHTFWPDLSIRNKKRMPQRGERCSLSAAPASVWVTTSLIRQKRATELATS